MKHSGTPNGDFLDFFLSEMSVSDSHGGGLTLRRLLGQDLAKIERYILANDEPDARMAPEVKARIKSVLSVFQRPSTGRLIGCRPSHWLFTRGLVRAHHARRIAHVLERSFPNKGTLLGLVCPQNQDAVSALEHLKSRREVKYISWMMDDNVLRYVDGQWIYPARFQRLLAKHLHEADTVFVISPAMAEFYERLFGVKSTVLFSPADDFQEPSREPAPSDGILKIGYFGGLWKWQLDSLVRFASALEPSQRLDIYTADMEAAARLNLPGVTAKGFLPKDAVRRAMQDYDAVLLPFSFSDAYRSLVDLNIATKMSECLASGTITIVFAPERAAMVRFLQPTGAACVITDASLENWPSLAQGLRDVGYRRRVIAAAQRLVKTDLSTDVMRGRWRAALNKLMAHRKPDGSRASAD